MSADSGYSTHTRSEMVKFIPERRKRVLEVGCVEGNFLMFLPRVEEAWGIEPSLSARIAKGRLHRVFETTFDEAEPHLLLDYFDVVVCNDVIEHMPDHDKFFERIVRYIAPGGVIVGSIPNVRFYNNLLQMVLEKDWYYTDSGILDRTHMRYFTEKSLKACLQRHGFVLNRFEGLKVKADTGSGRAGVYYLMSRLLVVATFGYFSDIQYLQFAFQALPARR
jgi:SAM-dependent methyltransferase